MKTHLAFILIYGVCALGAFAQQPEKHENTAQTELLRVHTALDHITVIEFGEPVTMAAAGSSAFRIERQENKVLIEPLKTGAATNLLVWTVSRRFTYELEPAGEVNKMNVAIDSSTPKSNPVANADDQMQHVADMVLTKAFLGARQIQNNGIKATTDGVLVRVQQIFQSKDTVYIHYSVENHSQRSFRMTAPSAYELHADHSSVAVLSLVHKQLSRAAVARLGQTTQRPLPLAVTENNGPDVAPGLDGQGVVAIRQRIQSPSILQLEFNPDVKATLVF